MPQDIKVSYLSRGAERPPQRSAIGRPHLHAAAITLSDHEPYEFEWEGRHAYLALHDIRLADGEMRVAGASAEQPRDLRRIVTFTPQGAAISGWAKPQRRRNRFVALSFRIDDFAERMGRPIDYLALAPRVHVRDDRLEAILTKLGWLIENESVVDDVLVDALALMAVVELTKADAEIPARGRLSPQQLRRVRDYIDANIARSVSLDDIAGAAGLSAFHLIRAFKQATGVSPYRYLLCQRVDRAKELLRRSDMPIAAIAAAAGFTSASQLSRTFTAIAGETPRAFRRRLAT